MIDRRSTFQIIYSYGTVNSIFVEIQSDSTNIKNDPRMSIPTQNIAFINEQFLIMVAIFMTS